MFYLMTDATATPTRITVKRTADNTVISTMVSVQKLSRKQTIKINEQLLYMLNSIAIHSKS